LPVIVLAVFAFAAGAVLASGSPERDSVERFLDAWASEDYPAMYAELTPDTAAAYSEDEFTAAYEDAAEDATATGVAIGELDGPRSEGESEVVAADVGVETNAFGEVSGEVAVPVADGAVAWEPNVTFPGLQPGEKLDRKTRAPERASILASDGKPLAEGPSTARTSPYGTAAASVAGTMAAPKRQQAQELAAIGFPKSTLVGDSGLEQAFNSRLLGTPGGQLLAVAEDGESRVLAESEPVEGEPVQTTIDGTLQEITVSALGSAFGGAAVLDAQTGEVRALAGLAYSSPQAPGSTMKIVTTVAALEDGKVKLDDEFPVVNGANVGGRFISNAGGEYCGGTFVESFAHSCNSVFAPLGAEVGSKRLVEVSELFGFNEPPPLYSDEIIAEVEPPESSLPEDLGDDLNTGVSAIGQGLVLATPLEMASISQTIAAEGVRSATALVTDPELAPDFEPVTVTTPEIANTVRDLMIEVVNQGTGENAALADVQVAGKTGTAETGVEGGDHAWFTAFAPAENAELAVAVAVFNAGGAGGDIAAPIVASILSSGLPEYEPEGADTAEGADEAEGAGA
jgi:cell division protein FtsI/penicillin-binding protein 2